MTTYTENLHSLMFALQKQRSNIAETHQCTPAELDHDGVMGDLEPALFGPDSCLRDVMVLQDSGFDHMTLRGLYLKLDPLDLSLPLSPRQLLDCTLELTERPLTLSYHGALAAAVKEGVISTAEYSLILNKDYILSNPDFHQRLKSDPAQYERLRAQYSL